MLQDIDQASNDQIYPLGMRYVLDDRVFRYAKAGGTLNTDVGAKNTLPQMFGYSPVQAALIAAKTVVLDVIAGGGRLGDGVIAANELAGGYINIFTHELIHPPTSWTINRRIVTNTAIAGAEAMTVTIDKPLPVGLTGGNTMHAEGIASPYGRVMSGSPVAIPLVARMSVVGFPTVYATVGQYLWLQTWGPVWGAPVGGGGYGDGDNNRLVVFTAAGNLDDYDAALPALQHAGFVMCNAVAGGPGVAIFWLQLSP